jgi:hypothetical protein
MCILGRVGKFLPVRGKKPVFSMEKNRFFPWKKTGFFHGKNRPGKNSFCWVEKTTRQKPGKISFANIYQVEKVDF